MVVVTPHWPGGLTGFDSARTDPAEAAAKSITIGADRKSERRDLMMALAS
jgi:hypothetical protein